jgi:hypothetical protein
LREIDVRGGAALGHAETLREPDAGKYSPMAFTDLLGDARLVL